MTGTATLIDPADSATLRAALDAGTEVTVHVDGQKGVPGTLASVHADGTLTVDFDGDYQSWTVHVDPAHVLEASA